MSPPGTPPTIGAMLPIDVVGIVTEAILPSTPQGLVATISASSISISTTLSPAGTILDLKKLRLKFVCGIASDENIPPI